MNCGSRLVLTADRPRLHGEEAGGVRKSSASRERVRRYTEDDSQEFAVDIMLDFLKVLGVER